MKHVLTVFKKHKNTFIPYGKPKTIVDKNEAIAWAKELVLRHTNFNNIMAIYITGIYDDCELIISTDGTNIIKTKGNITKLTNEIDKPKEEVIVRKRGRPKKIQDKTDIRNFL